MKIVSRSLFLLMALAVSISFVSCKQETKDKVKDAGEAVVEETQEAADKAGQAVKEAAEDVKDAMVEGTKYHATGMVPCKLEGQPSGNCDFGVYRKGNGTADVTITRPDGNTVTVHFEIGEVKGVDETQEGFRPDYSVKKESDLYIITIGEDRYEIPDAVLIGG